MQYLDDLRTILHLLSACINTAPVRYVQHRRHTLGSEQSTQPGTLFGSVWQLQVYRPMCASSAPEMKLGSASSITDERIKSCTMYTALSLPYNSEGSINIRHYYHCHRPIFQGYVSGPGTLCLGQGSWSIIAISLW